MRDVGGYKAASRMRQQGRRALVVLVQLGLLAGALYRGEVGWCTALLLLFLCALVQTFYGMVAQVLEALRRANATAALYNPRPEEVP